jgi:probable rRNA maturation factor
MPDQTSADETNEDESTLLVEIVTEQSDWEKGAWDGVQDDIQHAAIAAFHAGIDARTDISFPDVDIEISIRLTDDKEMATLNGKWRQIERPTNVLSFPNGANNLEADFGELTVLLGDVVLARETIEAEAEAANLPPVNHVKHLVVHGVLHLLGFDHEIEHEADIMEALEVEVLATIGVASPYEDNKRKMCHEQF